MMGRRTFGGLLAGGAALLLGGCGNYGDNSYRVRVTVEIETPAGIKRGSSVLEVHSSKNIKILADERSGSGGLKGEAVVVDTPGGPVFILLKQPGAGEGLDGAVTVALAPEAAKGGIDNYVSAVRRLGGMFASTATAELPRADWPMMVRFGDINDPKSVERVDPQALGVKRILLETTGDDVTSGIEKRLGWLDALESTSSTSVFQTSASSLVDQLRKK